MTSKKPAQQKRAKLPRKSDRTRQFAKDWERLSHSGRYDMRRLKEAMMLLIANDDRCHRNTWITSSAASGVAFANATSAGIFF